MKHPTKRLLVAVDGSPHARDEVAYVARTCSPERFQVDLLHVLPQAPEEVFWQVSLDEDFMVRMKQK